jgi:hypothetical protein
LIQGDDFVDEIGVVAFLEVEHIVRFIEDIEGSEASAEEACYFTDANGSDTVDIEAVNLACKGGNLFKQ